MQIEECRQLVEAEMALVDELITTSLASDVVLINQMSSYIVSSGGKRLRPQLVLLSAGACGYTGAQHIDLAAIVEFIHTATLLHDDVVDASALRRGQDTANSVWGNEAAVLVGDFLYSRSFEMMVAVNRMRIMEVLAATTNRIAEGEVMQLMNVHEPDLSEADYINVIQAKTARLFEAATQLGAVLSESDDTVERGLAEFGKCLGTAFQIADDVLDYSSDAVALGKQVGDDLEEGKPTLPLILALKHADSAQRQVLADAIREGGRERIDDVMAIIEKTGALEESMRQAHAQAVLAKTALSVLPESDYRRAMAAVADFSVERLN